MASGKKLDPYGMKFAKGHRTAEGVKGWRPITRTKKRPLRPK